jgi:hypothetical protein
LNEIRKDILFIKEISEASDGPGVVGVLNQLL